MSCACCVVTELVEVYEKFGNREDKGGWSRVVGYVSILGGSGASSPIWEISARRTLWSLNSVDIAVVIVCGGCYVSVGMRSNQWSRGVLVGGSPR